MAPRADDDGSMHQVTIGHALFSYGERPRKMALRGATIEVGEEDYQRGLEEGAFVDSPEELAHHGVLPEFDYDADDEADINAWMRSASTSDVANALAAAAAEGRDIREMMLAGELSRGNEVRADVLQLINSATEASALELQQQVLSEIRAEHVDVEEDPAGATVPTVPASVEDPGIVILRDRVEDLRQQLGLDEDADLEVVVATAIERLLAAPEGETQEPPATDPTASSTDDGPAPAPIEYSPASDKIDDIVAWVAGDPAKAAIALEQETASKADKARPRLVSQLQEVIGGGDS